MIPIGIGASYDGKLISKEVIVTSKIVVVSPNFNLIQFQFLIVVCRYQFWLLHALLCAAMGVFCNCYANCDCKCIVP